jgi:uncharacterized membrane protein YeiH
VPGSQPLIPIWIELVAVGVGAVGGAVFAVYSEDDRNEFDVLAAFVFALVMALGGGIIRDVLLNRVPAALTHESYLLTAVGAGAAGMLLAQALRRIPGEVNNALDSAVLGLFVVVGTIKADEAGLGEVATILLGTITGVGGGVLRDLLAQRPVELMQRASPYVVVAALGASAFVGLSALGASQALSASVTFVTIVAIRVVALERGWRTPGPPTLPSPTRGYQVAQRDRQADRRDQ